MRMGRLLGWEQPLICSHFPPEAMFVQSDPETETFLEEYEMREVFTPLRLAVMGLAILFGLSMLAQSQSNAQSKSRSQSSSETGVMYQPSPAVKAKADSPMPGPNAKQQSKRGTIGQGRTTVKTTNQNSSFWVEE